MDYTVRVTPQHFPDRVQGRLQPNVLYITVKSIFTQGIAAVKALVHPRSTATGIVSARRNRL